MPLRVRAYDFLSSKGEVDGRREAAEALGLDSDSVGNYLRRLWRRGFILRTREPVYRFESSHKGRAGLLCNTRVINYYVYE